jgi:hypothetical protein
VPKGGGPDASACPEGGHALPRQGAECVRERHGKGAQRDPVKPTESGKLVKIQKAENQFITDVEVCEERVPDGALWGPSLEPHQESFGRAP